MQGEMEEQEEIEDEIQGIGRIRGKEKGVECI